jgi:predicted esterase
MKPYLILYLILFAASALSQDKGIISELPARHFQLKNSIDTIDFILLNGKIDKMKPVLIFCQGSNPLPLITIDANSNKFFTLLTNFDYKKITEEFHLIMISMPNTPVEISKDKLNNNYCFVTDTSNEQSYSPLYLKNNYADNYIRRAKEVINYLSLQKWVNSKKIILFGHSQGSKVAIGASLNNPKVFKVGYAAGNPLGRIDQLIREQRKLEQEGKVTAVECQQQIESIYEMWKQINEKPNAVTTEFGDPNKTWTSFSKPILDDIINLNKPLYVTYGTKDITSTFCDLLPIYFIKANKNNLTLKPILGVEHNFYEIDSNGRTDYKKGHWQDVIDDFIKWTKE